MRTRTKFTITNAESYLRQATEALQNARAADASELASDREYVDSFLKTASECAAWVVAAIDAVRQQEAARN